MASLILNHNEVPFLFLGDIHDAMSKHFLDTNNIKYILNCTDDIPKFFPEMKFLRVPVEDREDEDISEHFDAVIKFIDDAREKGDGALLVHCFSGVSRSASVVTAYLMRTGMTLRQALEYVNKRRCVVCPNQGFFYQLKKRERVKTNFTYETFMSAVYHTASSAEYKRVMNDV